MKRIFVRKTLAYDPTIGGQYSRYRGYAYSTTQKTAPQLSNLDQKLVISIQIAPTIFCSKLLRSRQTAETLSFKNIKQTALLNEVKFDLTKLLTEKQFQRQGSKLVRQKFVEAFINDELLESRQQIKMRVESLLKLLIDLPEGNYLIISHSFFMKILQSFLDSPNLFEKPIRLKKYIDNTKKTFEFGQGFDFSI